MDVTADAITSHVDELLGTGWDRKRGEAINLAMVDDDQDTSPEEPVVEKCACGSGIPVQKLQISGKEVTLVGLPLIYQQFYEAGKSPTAENMNELMETIKIYNPIPADEEPAYREGIQKAYTYFWFKEKGR